MNGPERKLLKRPEEPRVSCASSATGWSGGVGAHLLQATVKRRENASPSLAVSSCVPSHPAAQLAGCCISPAPILAKTLNGELETVRAPSAMGPSTKPAVWRERKMDSKRVGAVCCEGGETLGRVEKRGGKGGGKERRAGEGGEGRIGRGERQGRSGGGGS